MARPIKTRLLFRKTFHVQTIQVLQLRISIVQRNFSHDLAGNRYELGVRAAFGEGHRIAIYLIIMAVVAYTRLESHWSFCAPKSDPTTP
jgi:hypothetical protein